MKQQWNNIPAIRFILQHRVGRDSQTPITSNRWKTGHKFLYTKWKLFDFKITTIFWFLCHILFKMILQHLDLTHKSLSLPKISFNPGRVNAPNCLLKWFHYEDTEKNISSTTGGWTQEADDKRWHTNDSNIDNCSGVIFIANCLIY